MEQLFVVNRYNADVPEVNADDHLTKVLNRIEKNKKLRAKQKERLKVKEKIENKLKKRERKAKIVKVPENQDELIDQDILKLDETEKEIKKGKNELDIKNLEGFTVLGKDNFSKKHKVRRILPQWLAHPTIISVNLQNLECKVSKLKTLDKTLRKKLEQNGIKYFFPVQAEVIPWLLQTNKHSSVLFPRDICVSAPTGSGKTLAFVLPVIQALMHHMVKKIRALVILPTQDLAVQVFKTFKKYAQGTNIDVCLITGQTSFLMEQKRLVYKNEAFGYLSKTDILICTAGRLVDHLTSTEGFDLHYLEFLVIDEADRVLDNVQNDWLYHLEKHIYGEEQHSSKNFNLFSLNHRRPPQKLLFSATLSQDPEKLEKLSLFHPKLFTSTVESDDANEGNDSNKAETFVGKYTIPKELTEKFIVCSMELKPLVLYEFIKMEKLTKTMVFTHSLDSAHRLAILLRSMFNNEFKIEEISSNLESKNRNNLIGAFSKGDIDLLVCTDSLARGIDLPGVQCVISYSCPKYLRTYIHRAGRTARAGEQGLTVSMLHSSQLNKFRSLLHQTNKSDLKEIKISEDGLEPLAEQYQQALSDLKKAVDEEEKRELLKIKSAKGKGKKRKRKQVTFVE